MWHNESTKKEFVQKFNELLEMELEGLTFVMLNLTTFILIHSDHNLVLNFYFVSIFSLSVQAQIIYWTSE